ncbi:MAG: serpin family protein, partial [Gemmatimonadales bacterium]
MRAGGSALGARHSALGARRLGGWTARRLGGAAGLLVAAGCGLIPTSEGPPPLLATLPRALTPAETRLITASNEFGFDLLDRVRAAAPDSNAFLSPISAAMALGMTLNGAAGLTLDSMRLALQMADLPQGDVNAGFQSL